MASSQQNNRAESFWMKALIWLALVSAVLVPMVIAANSPLLQWREPIYVVAGFAGSLAMALLLIQPLLVKGYLPGLQGALGKRVHRWAGAVLLVAVVVHVCALWITSPPDVIDALLLRSPTPFSVWGVIAMWAVIAAAALAALRRRLPLKLRQWRLAHTILVVIVVAGSVIHAMLIEGTMGTVSKALLCFLALGVTLRVVYLKRSWVF